MSQENVEIVRQVVVQQPRGGGAALDLTDENAQMTTLSNRSSRSGRYNGRCACEAGGWQSTSDEAFEDIHSKSLRTTALRRAAGR